MLTEGKQEGRARILLALAALAAGVLNGLLGTGGGMVLTLSLRAAYPEKEREAMALSTACMLLFSILTTILYLFQGHIDPLDALPVLLPALLGGGVGALFLGRIGSPLLDAILAVLLVLSGISLLQG